MGKIITIFIFLYVIADRILKTFEIKYTGNSEFTERLDNVEFRVFVLEKKSSPKVSAGHFPDIYFSGDDTEQFKK